MRGYLGRYGSDIGRLEADRGSVRVASGAAADNPSYLAWSADGTVVYAVLEKTDGEVSAFAAVGGDLEPLGAQSTGGTSPCHVSVHPGGGYLFTANYGSGSVAVHPIGSDGRLGTRTGLVQHTGRGPVAPRQEGAHAHMVITEPIRGDVLAVDLGTDTVYRYRLIDGRLDLSGSAAMPPGSGPRHLAFHPDGAHAFVASELEPVVTVLDLRTFERGTTYPTTPAGRAPRSQPSAIRVSDDGRFCYVANRGSDTIAVFAVEDGPTLRLVATVPCGGEHPRDLVLADGHLYVANQLSDSVTSFEIDIATGVPRPTGAVGGTPAPTCLLLPATR